MNNQTPDLSPEARRIINAARGADDPTSEDQARVKTRWLAGVAAVAGVSSLTEAARAAGGIGWGLKAVGAAAALVAGAVGLYVALPEGGGEHSAESPPAWAGRTHERHEKMVTPPQRGEVQAREVAAASRAGGEPSVGAPSVPDGEPEVVAAAPALAPAIPPGAAEAVPNAPAASPALDVPADRPAVDVSARPVRERAVASRAVQPRSGGARAVPVVAVPPQASASQPAASQAVPAAAANPSGQLGEELTLLSRVRSSVQDGAPQRALELLADYEARFGQAILAMEADALRVDALCQAGQREAAQASAAAFQNEWPGSPLGRRVSAACP